MVLYEVQQVAKVVDNQLHKVFHIRTVNCSGDAGTINLPGFRTRRRAEKWLEAYLFRRPR